MSEHTNCSCALNKRILPVSDSGALNHFTTEKIEKVLAFQKTHPSYTKTPLRSLPALSDYLNVGEIHVKDESYRFGLNAFKAMGGIYAIAQYLANVLNRDIADLSFTELQSEEVREKVGDITFISATDGNHGRGVAWAAKELGQKSVIYMPKGSLPTRLQAIRNEGAIAQMTDVNYDETVRMTAKMAEDNGWVIVQDTGWDGYEEIPLWIMQGYASIAHEIIQELESSCKQLPTHIFLQAGVGSFAAGIVAYFKQYYKENAPTFVIVESDQADCYYQSFWNPDGEMEVVTGDMATIMAGLACGEPNKAAFQILSQYVSAAYSCDEAIAALGMRVLGNPLTGDPSVVSGESGAVPLGLLHHLRCVNDTTCRTIGLDEASRVLLINTEGDTDSEQYRNIVWNGLYSM